MGFWSSLKKAVKKVVKTVKKVVRAVKDIVMKVGGVLDFIISFIGIRPKKYLRLKIFILQVADNPVQRVERVEEILDKTVTVFKEKCNIEVKKAWRYEDYITVMPENAPDYALTTDCSFGAAFSDASDYYDDSSRYSFTSASAPLFDSLGYGEVIFCFVIKDISGTSVGCSYPLMQNYLLIDLKAGATTIAHEIGHMAWLHHVGGERNLMNSKRNLETDYEMSRYQISQVRTSKFVTYIPRW